MGQAYFYHITRAPFEVTLAMLITKARGAGWRVAVRAPDAQLVDWLDQKLWLGNEADFLPHGIAGGPHDDLQPVLLTTGAASADCLMTVAGANVTPDEVTACQRVCVLFDGNDPDAVQTARVHWKTLTDAGCGAQYWSEESGRWEMKAQKNC